MERNARWIETDRETARQLRCYTDGHEPHAIAFDADGEPMDVERHEEASINNQR